MRRRSAADLAAARLSAQGELAIDYFSLREADCADALLAQTIDGYERSLQITQNRYDAGIAAKTDVLQAQTQLANAQADALALARHARSFEHAIAVLVGQAPGDFTLAPAPWKRAVPAVPLGVPSTLLQRRPDIAAAERRVPPPMRRSASRASAYFPSLDAERVDTAAARAALADLFSASSTLWSFGLSVAQTMFDAGATGARVAGAEAGARAAVARYRQTVLTAFQGVEDQLDGNARAGAAGSAAPAGVGRGRPDRAADPQSLQRRPGQLHRGRHGAGDGAERAARAGAGAGRPAGERRSSLIQALGGGLDVTAPVELKSSLRSDNAP